MRHRLTQILASLGIALILLCGVGGVITPALSQEPPPGSPPAEKKDDAEAPSTATGPNLVLAALAAALVLTIICMPSRKPQN